MTYKLLSAIILLLITGCNQQPSIPKLVHTEPAEGYKILCDGKGHYGVKYPDGFISLGEWSSREEAIAYTWMDHGISIEVKRTWKECDK